MRRHSTILLLEGNNIHPHRVNDSIFILVEGEYGEIHLSTKHEYHIQGQRAVSDSYNRDFVCWTLCGLHYEHVVADHDHLIGEVKPALDTYLCQFYFHVP